MQQFIYYFLLCSLSHSSDATSFISFIKLTCLETSISYGKKMSLTYAILLTALPLCGCGISYSPIRNYRHPFNSGSSSTTPQRCPISTSGSNIADYFQIRSRPRKVKNEKKLLKNSRNRKFNPPTPTPGILRKNILLR